MPFPASEGFRSIGAVTGSFEPLTPRSPIEANRAFEVAPFARVARAHGASTMADAMVAASLAGSLFFSLPADGARAPVLRYLIITMLPFAVVSPLIGPLIDRMKGGHRLMVIGSALARSFICWMLLTRIDGESPVFFLLALCLLVGQKAYQVARSALVPAVVRSDAELVQANSKLSLISGIAGFVGVVPAAILLKLIGPSASIALAMLTYLAAAALAMKIPSVTVANEAADATERHELRGASIVMAGSAMGLVRACVGFLTLLVAFDFRGGDRPAWQFGLVAGVSVLSQLAGAAAAPHIRRLTSEENLLSACLALVVVGAVTAFLIGEVPGACLLGACVGFAAGAGKLAFDSILQRDAPDANRGRAFARFETRFQVTWVLGALVPVAIHLHATAGFGVVLVLALVALASYMVGRLAYAHRTGARQNAATAAAVGIETRFAEVSGEVKGRLASAPRAALRRIRPGRDDAVDLVDGSAAGIGPGDEADPTRVVGPPTEEVTGPTVVASDPGRPHADPTEVDIEVDIDTAPTWADDPQSSPYLADVDPTVANPYPWTPDDAPSRGHRF